MSKEVKIKRTFTRAQLIGMNSDGRPHEYNAVNTGNRLNMRLLEAGIPIIGGTLFGIVAVEWGTLTISHDPDGLDGDEWTYTWIGREVPQPFRRDMAKPTGTRNRLDQPLAARIALADDEL